jgi:Bacterial protein of unknown function (HtrL_YibB)
MDYTIITAWYNLREKENHQLKNDDTMSHFCTPAHYYNSLKLLLDKSFPVIVFTEPSCEEKIWENRPKELHHLTRVIVKDYDELSMYCYFEQYIKNHNKNSILNVDPIKFTPLYKFIVLQKTEFLKEGAMINPFSTKQFAWMDTRLHSVYNMGIDETNEIFSKIEPNKLLIHQMAYTKKDEIQDRKNFYLCTRGKIAAGLFGGYYDQVMKFAKLCKQEILDSINDELAPTDEMVYAYVVGKNPELFTPYFGDYSEMLKNVLYVKNNAHLAINFMNISFNCGTHYYTMKVCEALKKGFDKEYFNLSIEHIFNVYYYNYVANYWLGNKERCVIILEQLYDICQTNENMKNYVKDRRDFFMKNISYLNNKSMINKYDDII